MVQIGMSDEEGTFYQGSRLFRSTADAVGLPLDQNRRGSKRHTKFGYRFKRLCGDFNFLICMLFGLVFGLYFRDVLSPKTTSPLKRHLVELVVGLVLTYFCFGYQIWHLVALSSVCYLVMLFGPRDLVHKLVFIISMGYICTLHIYRQYYDYGGFTLDVTGQAWHLIALSTSSYLVMIFGPRDSIHKIVFILSMGYICILHIFRQYYDYGGYSLDVTGPMMIMVQKTTTIAFALHDGERVPEEKLSADQKTQMLKKCPDALHYYSYMFYFHGVMVGPLSFYNDYMKFIDGSDYVIVEPEVGNNVKNNTDRKIPSSTQTVIENGLISVACGVVMLFSPIYVPFSRMAEDDFVYNTTFLYRIMYILLCVTLVRGKYYFAWKLGETINNAAGMGFNGYDKDGNAKWDLLNNVDIYILETCTSLKVNVDCWNKLTIVWLRRVVYDRAPMWNTMAVFALSCIWHGFYPGYYLCFSSAIVLTMAARQIRRNIRPYFLKSPQLKFFYDCVTFAFTRYANVYITSTHVLLSFMPGFRLLMSQYFCLHILSLVTVLIFSFVKLAPQPKKTEKIQ